GQLSPPVELRAEVEHLRGSIEFGCGTPAAGYAVLVAGSELVAAADPARAARMLAEAGIIAWMGGDVAGVVEASRRVARLPEPTGAGALIGQVVPGLGSFLGGRPRPAPTPVPA